MARLVFRLRHSDHISAVLVSFHSSLFTAYGCWKGSSSRSPCRLIGSCVMLRCTFGSSHTPLTSRLGKDFGPLPPIVRTICSGLASDFLLLDITPFLLLVHVYGTTYLRTLPPHCLCLHLSSDRKGTYSVAPTPVLFT